MLILLSGLRITPGTERNTDAAIKNILAGLNDYKNILSPLLYFLAVLHNTPSKYPVYPGGCILSPGKNDSPTFKTDIIINWVLLYIRKLLTLRFNQ